MISIENKANCGLEAGCTRCAEVGALCSTLCCCHRHRHRGNGLGIPPTGRQENVGLLLSLLIIVIIVIIVILLLLFLFLLLLLRLFPSSRPGGLRSLSDLRFEPGASFGMAREALPHVPFSGRGPKVTSRRRYKQTDDYKRRRHSM